MSESQPESTQRKRKYQPKFYEEVNISFNIKGMNIMGMIPSVILSAVFLGLTLWEIVPPLILFGVWLSKRMGVEPNFHREVFAHIMGGHRWCLAGSSPPAEPIRVLTKDGRAVPLSGWLEGRKEC